MSPPGQLEDAAAKARGIGIACTERGGGAGLGGATVKVNLDGSAHVLFASTDIGQGSRTTLSMVATVAGRVGNAAAAHSRA